MLGSSLADAEPVGVVGAGDWVALLHRSPGPASLGARGGGLVPPVVLAGAWLSIVPFDALREPEADDGELDPPVLGARVVDERGTLVVGPGGFEVEVAAPPGSRVVVAELDPSDVRLSLRVDATGRLAVPVPPVATSVPNPLYRVALIVTTPAGRGYLASWDVRVLTAPPALEATTMTPFGSSEVTVTGRTASFATVLVDGREIDPGPDGRFTTSVPLPPWPTQVVVEARDFAGNVARTIVTGVGIFDWRALPWIPIVVVLVGAAAVVLFLRVPRSLTPPRRADDDAVLEEMESD